MKKTKILLTSLSKFGRLLDNKNRKSLKTIFAALILGIGIGVTYEEIIGIGTWHSYHPETDKFNLCFTPPSGCGSLIATEIANAKTSIYMQAYGLTAPNIIYQLKAANKRGVKVHILLDNSKLSNNQQLYKDLQASNIWVKFDKLPGIAHNKVIIIDRSKIITGSYNFTKAADTKNAENVILIKDKEIAEKYLQNWFERMEANKKIKA